MALEELVIRVLAQMIAIVVFLLMVATAGVGLTIVVAPLAAPSLLSTRVRTFLQYLAALRRDAPPERVGPSGVGSVYVVTVFAITVLYTVVQGVLVLLLGYYLDNYSRAAYLGGAVAVGGLAWGVPVRLLPRRGHDWSPNGYDAKTHAVFGGIAVWLALLFAAVGGLVILIVLQSISLPPAG